jgi:hypothetical protein
MHKALEALISFCFYFLSCMVVFLLRQCVLRHHGSFELYAIPAMYTTIQVKVK